MARKWVVAFVLVLIASSYLVDSAVVGDARRDYSSGKGYTTFKDELRAGQGRDDWTMGLWETFGQIRPFMLILLLVTFVYYWGQDKKQDAVLAVPPKDNAPARQTKDTVKQSSSNFSTATSNSTSNEPQKKRINAKDVLRDMRAGLDDIGLMQKYGLSAKQLTALYKKLEDAGLLGKA
jgi:hypothetical protein